MNPVDLKQEIHSKLLELLRTAGVAATRVSTDFGGVCAYCPSEAEADKALAFYRRVGLASPSKESSRLTGTWFAKAKVMP